jgi:hypothetical protein
LYSRSGCSLDIGDTRPHQKLLYDNNNMCQFFFNAYIPTLNKYTTKYRSILVICCTNRTIFYLFSSPPLLAQSKYQRCQASNDKLSLLHPSHLLPASMHMIIKQSH